MKHIVRGHSEFTSALNFDGVDDYMTTGNITLKDITASIWIKPTTLT